MSHKLLLPIFLLILSFLSLPSSQCQARPIVFCEEGTATWCTACPNTADALHAIYKSGDYAFYYVALVADKNPKAEARLEKYNIAAFPTTFFDGGYKIVFGGVKEEEPYRNAIENCMTRDRANIDISLSVSWEGNGNIGISLSIQNNENEIYEGNLKIYIVEPISRWKDRNGNPYHFGFLDFAFDEDVVIQKDGQLQKSKIWNASEAGYPDVERNNIMAIAVVFSKDAHIKYSDPPTNNHKFNAYYVDAVAVAKPPKDAPPETYLLLKPPSITGYRNVTFSWIGKDDFTPQQDILYSYMLVGYDATWSPWSNEQETTYQNLPDGTYTFNVKSKDNSGQEDETPASWSFTVDTSPPSVISTKPKHNSINVAAYSSVSILFSFDMEKESVEKSIEINPNLPYTTHWNGKREIIITPNDKWEYNTIYTITIHEGARRTSGQEMQEYAFSFEIEGEDVLPPTIVSTIPANEGKIKAGEEIVITFSEPMNTLSLHKALHIQPWIPYHISWEMNDTCLHIIPKEWNSGRYEIVITKYASDKHGNRLNENYTLTFEIALPSIISISPSNGEREVPISTNITITFSEEMDKKSVEESFAIQPEITFTMKWDGNTLIIHPLTNLEYEKEYVIKIGKDAKNVYNISIGSDYVVSFSTEGKVPERMLEEVPSFTVMSAFLAILLILLRKLNNAGRRKHE